MRTSPRFHPDPSQLLDSLAAHPLAQLVSACEGQLAATALPLLVESLRDGAPSTLIGHLARGNPQVALLRQQPRAMCLFLGAHGYISPSWLGDRSQAPTWNAETSQFIVDVELLDDAADTEACVEALVRHVEDRPGRGWRSAELGARRRSLLGAVVGFRARVVEARLKFKLGQNERDDVLADALDGLANEGHGELASAMRRANTGRLGVRA